MMFFRVYQAHDLLQSLSLQRLALLVTLAASRELVQVGAGSCIDRGSWRDTVIGAATQAQMQEIHA
eukprot:2871142-Pleurochrysis_carterae.AAC.6